MAPAVVGTPHIALPYSLLTGLPSGGIADHALGDSGTSISIGAGSSAGPIIDATAVTVYEGDAAAVAVGSVDGAKEELVSVVVDVVVDANRTNT